MAELLIRRPLFPGADYVKQLEYIINYLGAQIKKKKRKKDISPPVGVPGADDAAFALVAEGLVH
jgi:hypothetical protein